MKHLEAVTIYPEVNQILILWTRQVQNVIGQNLIGLYLFGSLAYGDFVPQRSDIDLVAVTKSPLSSFELEKIKQIHLDIEDAFPAWKNRIECSYIPQIFMKEVLPPKQTRPYFGGGVWYEKADYGNEWLINQYFLYYNSIALVGPEYKSLLDTSPDPREVQKASIRDLFHEWKPKIQDSKWLENSHYQSYLVLNLCRILHTLHTAKLGSKRIAAEWVKEIFPDWKELIEEAEAWDYDKEMKQQEKVIAFIRFVIRDVGENAI